MKTICGKKQELRKSVILENQGEKIFAVLHTPLELDVPPPVVIVLHGYASQKCGTSRAYVTLAEALASAGIATFRFDFRGCGDSEGSLAKMAPSDFISDVFAVYAHLRQAGFSRLALFGSSFGGSVGVLATEGGLAIQSLLLWAPVASGQLWYRDWLKHHPSGDPSSALKTYRGVTINDRFKEQFATLEANRAIEKLGRVPLLHMQGDRDDTTSLAHQLSFQKYRESASARSEFITYPGVDHHLGQAAILPDVIAKSVEWFNSTL